MDNQDSEKTCNGIPINVLTSFIEKQYPNVKVSIKIDSSLQERCIDGYREGDTIFLASEIPLNEKWQQIDPTIKLTKTATVYLVLLREFARDHLFLRVNGKISDAEKMFGNPRNPD